MRFSSLVQLARPDFEIHFASACRDRHLAKLGAVTQLLHAEPIADLNDSYFASKLANVDILVTGWKSNPINADLLRKMPKLKLVAHLAGTVKGILDRDAVSSGLTVISGAEANARPVAEFTLAHILLHLKRVPEWRRVYRDQRSSIVTRRTELSGPIGNSGRTVGIIGASKIGRRVAEELRRHRVRVLLHDPYVSAETASRFGAQKATMEDVLSQSDVVSLHQPLLATTKRSFGAAQFSRMRDGALLINTARGAIIDPKALEVAMSDGRLFAVLDVTDPEPLPDTSPLWNMPNVTLTPHIAGSFGCEVCEMTEQVLEDVERFTRGEPLQNEVIAADWEYVA